MHQYIEKAAIVTCVIVLHNETAPKMETTSILVTYVNFGTFIQVLRTFRGDFRASKVIVIKFIEIVILLVYNTIPFGFSLVWTLLVHQFSTFKILWFGLVSLIMI